MKRRFLQVSGSNLPSNNIIKVTKDFYEGVMDKNSANAFGANGLSYVIAKALADAYPTDNGLKDMLAETMNHGRYADKALGINRLASGNPFDKNISLPLKTSMTSRSVGIINSVLSYQVALLQSRAEIAICHHISRIKKVRPNAKSNIDLSDSFVNEGERPGLTGVDAVPDTIFPIIYNPKGRDDSSAEAIKIAINVITERLQAFKLLDREQPDTEKFNLGQSGEFMIFFNSLRKDGRFVAHFIPVATTLEQQISEYPDSGLNFNLVRWAADPLRDAENPLGIFNSDVANWPDYFGLAKTKVDVIVDAGGGVIRDVEVRTDTSSVEKYSTGMDKITVPVVEPVYEVKPADEYRNVLMSRILSSRIKQAYDNLRSNFPHSGFSPVYYPADLIMICDQLTKLNGLDVAQEKKDSFTQALFIARNYGQVDNAVGDLITAFIYPDANSEDCECHKKSAGQKLSEWRLAMRIAELGLPAQEVIAQIPVKTLIDSQTTGDLGVWSYANKASAVVSKQVESVRRLSYDLLSTHVFYTDL